MLPIAYIRQTVFGVTQSAFAEIAGVKQPTVSRWERGEWEPNRDELARIRDAAKGRGIEWKDDWFFAVPEARQ